MGRSTKIMLKSKDCTLLSTPKRMGIYRIGETRQIGQYFNVPLSIVRERDLHLPRPPVQLQTVSTEASRKLVIEHDKGLAKEIRLDIVMREPIDSD